MNIDDHFSASTLGFGLKYYVDYQGIKNNSENYFSNAKIKGIQIILGQEMYLNAKRMTEKTENLHQVALQVNLFLNKHIYIAGHTSFANFGNAGAYAEGLAGGGVSSKFYFKNRINLFAQVLAGAAGGGDIGTGEGFIVKPTLGFNYRFNEKLNFRTSVGKVKARGGNLSSTTLSFGINYNIGLLTIK